ncbi:YicC family protein [Flavobacteriales bacterium]|nr:YicC family protein [Flavobacteriales bacterium]
MIHSMTGFGKAELVLGEKKINVEIRSLNSKQADINTRISSVYREKELEVRKLLTKELQRGKIDFALYAENISSSSNVQVNSELIESYQSQLKDLPFTNDNSDFLSVVMRMPDVLINKKPILDENEWKDISLTIKNAISKFKEFRNQEGTAMGEELANRVNAIKNELVKVEDFEEERILKVKDRLKENLDKLEDSNIDQNRFEQEIIYYLEKFDVTEEKVRLANHCDYFLQTMELTEGQGKKLGFICQEMGREINTLGSKANHQEIQKIVVDMKDNLEKIKEQVLNVL